jgi:RND family efflux transporter MFP subunit
MNTLRNRHIAAEETPAATDIAQVRKKAAAGLALIALLLAAGLAHTFSARSANRAILQARTAERALLHVGWVMPDAGGDGPKLTLPGTLQGEAEVQVNARVTGYITAWHKDIGAPVKKGDLLATVELPDLQRGVDAAAARLDLAKIEYDRWTRLHAAGMVSQQGLDERTGSYQQANAELKRAQAQLAFGRIVAPFDGVVTRRAVNVGDLVQAGSRSLFTITAAKNLHLYLYVPHDKAAQVAVGDSVTIIRPDNAEQITARIARTAAAIDAQTRTLQVDVELPRLDHGLLPGTAVDAVLQLHTSPAFTIPTNTLLFSTSGPQVALVRDGKVVRHPVTLGINYGERVEVRNGLNGTDKVIVNPPDSLVTGQPVTATNAG